MAETGSRKRGRRGSPESWSVDTHVGQRVRMRRTLLGISQEKLGEAIGLTFQQVQKYERGSNRISAGTLYRLSQVLDVPVSFFFDCYEVPQGGGGAAATGGVASEGGISRREARLLRLWRTAPEPIAQEVLALLSSLAADAAVEDLGDVEDGDFADTRGNMMAGDGEDGGKLVGPRRGRRRHGAVWDPADIMRAARE